jgi:hypothetical protein
MGTRCLQLQSSGWMPAAPASFDQSKTRPNTSDSSPSTSICSAPEPSSNPVGARSSATTPSTNSQPAGAGRTEAAQHSTWTSDSCPKPYRGGSKRKFQPTAEIDELICTALKQSKVGSGALREAARLSGWPEKAVARRARELKLYKPAKLREWTPRELKRLHELAESGAADELVQQTLKQEFRVQRTIRSIKTKRQKLGLVFSREDASAYFSQTRRKYWPTQEIDEAIREVYGASKGAGALKLLQERLGWPSAPIIRRVRELGLSTPRGDGMPWSDAEEALLVEVGYQSVQAIQVHLAKRLGVHRTLSAIQMKLQRGRVRQSLGGMNLAQLADALGVAKKTVDRWLAAGHIRAILRFPELQAVNRHVWFFPNQEIRRFILAHLESIDLCRVEKFWFVDLLTNGKAGRAE